MFLNPSARAAFNKEINSWDYGGGKPAAGKKGGAKKAKQAAPAPVGVTDRAAVIDCHPA